MDPDLCIHSSLPSPLSSPLLPPLCRPLQCNPVPPYFVALLWPIKSLLKAPGLSHQQHIGQSDSLPLCRTFVAHCCPWLYSLSCCCVPEAVRVSLRMCCALFPGHHCDLHPSCRTALLSPSSEVLERRAHSCDCSLHHSLVWEMAHALLKSCSV